MTIKRHLLLPLMAWSLMSSPVLATTPTDDFEYFTERVGDIRILRYQVPGFEELSLQEKELLYYLSEAVRSGRDIIWDQNCKENLTVRRTLENIYRTFSGERTGSDWAAFDSYIKRVWFSNGIHHHYSTMKMLPDFNCDYLAILMALSDPTGFPTKEGESFEAFREHVSQIILDPDYLPKRVSRTDGLDCIAGSANNYYEGATEADVELFYEPLRQGDPKPSWGLNSKLVKQDGQLVEKVWKVGGMYDEALTQVVFWLENAVGVAQNDLQRTALEKLIGFYRTGDLHDFDDYCIAWVQNTDSSVDFINGFIENYGDAKGYRGAYEGIVSVRDPIASKRIEAISAQAQWFEDHSPIMDEYKKPSVKGISARVINVVMEAGDASPSTPIGVNLPNADWIRAEHGSKSVNLGNIVHAYGESSKNSGVLEEFYLKPESIQRIKADKGVSEHLHTDMHECIGHASGRMLPGVAGLGQYHSTLEEARADLVGLYYLMDPKLIELGVMESLDSGMCAYDRYITNGMMVQLRRIRLGDSVEEAHMQNRQMISKWAIEMGAAENVIERVVENGKTFYVVNDYNKLRTIFGQQLREIQRIKSEGDFEAGARLVENYGVKIERELHEEVLKRFATLDTAPYAGFINPELYMIWGNYYLEDVLIDYPTDFATQMLDYADRYSFLPNYN